ncbi:MAG TPA: heat-inducible transcriptional repressor HrcA [Hellea balneolensis]|uniref:Heat-inducible transcription repressor HrcA n=1 Tax=Hellea balneolensis TaxID=287478 RepID=A0A7C5LYY2_9PROT|nr:heat-inducible transcriptional repressor HrcA [Hellea balneolensis]
MSFISSSLSLSDLDARARAVFKSIVESYLETGSPVGSRTLSQKNTLGEHLSPATIRNTMADLAALGLLSSSHISAGRTPTHSGLRLFVDGLLEIGNISAEEQKLIDAQLQRRGDHQKTQIDHMLENASKTLAGLAGGAGLVLAPERSGALRHVEFVGLDGAQALAVLVYADGHVENRIMDIPRGLVPAALEQAGNYLSTRLKGRQLHEARTEILHEIQSGKAALDIAASQLVKQGIAEWAGDEKNTLIRNLIVRGRAQLLDNTDIQSDLERIRLLFEDLERKEELISLLDEAEVAKGVKIFIGAENPLFSLSGSSVVVAPYMGKDQKIIGAVGVIGPTRLNYARVIPMVDYTASVIGRLLQ